MDTTMLPRAIATAIGVLLLSSTSAVALPNGSQNGSDGNNACDFCNDNPLGETGSYSHNNGQHDFLLLEWNEPYHDKFREQDMQWGAAAETKLDNECDDHYLTFEQRIHDEYYYNLKKPVSYGSNLPLTSPPESENPLEDPFQDYEEFDTESRDCEDILQNTIYYLNIKIDAEKPPTSSEPKFWSELEWCEAGGIPWDNCKYDYTGRFKKKVLQQ